MTAIMKFKQLPRAVLVALVIATCIGCDQATKFVAMAYLKPVPAISFAGDLFRLQYAENSGAFLSLGSSLPEPWRQLIFTVFVGVFLFGLLLYVLLGRDLSFHHVTSLSLICSGGLSNLIDRIAYDGRVVDFLNVGIGPLRTGIFNVADMAITAGAMLLAIEGFRRTPEKS
jgi:signal peptidase II